MLPRHGPLRAVADAVLRAELRPVTRAVPPGATLLDIGAGAGNRSLQLARAGYRVTALEPDPREADAARLQLAGHAHVLRGTIRDIPGGTRYDAALLSHVLEHLRDPDTALGDIRARLASRGTLIVMVPNVGGAEARTLRGRWHGWEPARHHRHHTRATLRRALLDTGYEDVTVTVAGGWIHPATLAYSIAPALDPQNAPPGRALAGRALATLLAPVALAEVAVGAGPQLVATAQAPA